VVKMSKNSTRDLFQEYNIERRFCKCLLFATRESILCKRVSFGGGHTNKKGAYKNL